MPARTFEITSYAVKLGHTLSATFGNITIWARAAISCIGPDDQRVVAYFLAPQSPVPAPTTSLGGKWGLIFLPGDLLPVWIDLLRNEKPLHGYVNTDRPDWTNVSTSVEPVGEEEG